MTIKIGISGVRATVDEGGGLCPADIVRWSEAVLAYFPSVAEPRIVVGRDARRSSPAIAGILRNAFLLAGVEVVDLGTTLTPVLQLAVHTDPGAMGGVMVTASHNPIEWNGMKFVDADGLFIDATEIKEVGSARQYPSLAATAREIDGERAAWRQHSDAITSKVDVAGIRLHGYCVVIDACNGAAAEWATTLELLGCEVTAIHDERHGGFDRPPEPTPKNLGDLSAKVLEVGADIGFGADPDGDRLVVVDSSGVVVNEELTIVLAAAAIARAGDTVVTNTVTTHALEDYLLDVKVVRTAVGELNIVAGIVASQAVIGGEGSGGVVIPAMNMARDGLAAGAAILSLMASTSRSLGELVAGIPQWKSFKAFSPVSDADAVRFGTFIRRLSAASSSSVSTIDAGVAVVADGLRIEVSAETATSVKIDDDSVRVGVDGFDELIASIDRGASLDLTDGIKIHSDGAWLCLRMSNTEAILRVSGEVRKRHP
jgi:phosphomannomutase